MPSGVTPILVFWCNRFPVVDLWESPVRESTPLFPFCSPGHLIRSSMCFCVREADSCLQQRFHGGAGEPQPAFIEGDASGFTRNGSCIFPPLHDLLPSFLHPSSRFSAALEDASGGTLVKKIGGATPWTYSPSHPSRGRVAWRPIAWHKSGVFFQLRIQG